MRLFKSSIYFPFLPVNNALVTLKVYFGEDAVSSENSFGAVVMNPLQEYPSLLEEMVGPSAPQGQVLDLHTVFQQRPTVENTKQMSVAARILRDNPHFI